MLYLFHQKKNVFYSITVLLLLSCQIVSDNFATPWTVVCQAPLSMGVFRQEFWRSLPFPSPGHPPNPGIKPLSLMSAALAGRFFTLHHVENPFYTQQYIYVNPNLPIHSMPLSPPQCHMFVLYGCVSISALQIGSSVPFF